MTGSTVLQAREGSLWQLVVSYGIAAWIILQVAETLSSLIGLPLWFGRLLLVVLLVGFVFLLATSFVQRRAALGSRSGISSVLTWRNAVGGGIALALLVVVVTAGYLGLRAVGIGPLGTLQARGVLEEQERIILADFEGDVDQDGLAETVTTLLRIDLAQSPAFTVLEPVQLAPVLERMQRDPSDPVTYDVALEAARREGIKAVVAGELLQAGSALVVSARIVTAATGDALVAVRETVRDVSEIPEGVDRLSAQLRERIGESLRSIQGDPPLDEVTTPSIQALEKYARAGRANDAGDVERALLLLEEAIGEDSAFAMAHRKLGIVLQNSNLQPDRAREAFTRAYELRDRLTDRERWLAEAAYLTYVQGDEDAAIDRYVTLLDAYPSDRIALNNLGVAYWSRGRNREAVELYRRSILQGGAPAATYSSAISALRELGDVDGAMEIFRRFEEAHPENFTLDELRMQFAALELDYVVVEDVAKRIVERVRGTTGEGGALLELASVQLVRGRAAEAWETLVEGSALLDAAGIEEGVGSLPVVKALVAGVLAIHYREAPDEAAGSMDRARADNEVTELPVDERLDPVLAALYARAGNPDRATELLDRYASDSADDVQESARWLEAQAEVQLAEGRTDEAIDLLRRARERYGATCPLCGFEPLAHAFDVASRPDSAIYYYERYVTTPDMERLSSVDNIGFWAVLPRLGELHATHGDPTRARELLDRFLEVTDGADEAYQAKRSRVRGLLETLGG